MFWMFSRPMEDHKATKRRKKAMDKGLAKKNIHRSSDTVYLDR